MANPHKDQRRREAANVDGLHESSETRHHDWTELEGDREESDEGTHHHHHHHHHGDQSDRSRRDYERLAEDAHSRTHGGRDESERGRSRGGTAGQQGNDFGDDRGHTNRYGSRSANDSGTSRSPRTGGQSSDRHGTGRERDSHRREGRQGRDERQHGQPREQRGRESHQHGTPHEGSQRGSHREAGISGRMTGQRGSPDRHSDPSDSQFRDQTRGEREHRHGGEHGSSERDRRYGSRRGHGSQRDTDRRHSSH